MGCESSGGSCGCGSNQCGPDQGSQCECGGKGCESCMGPEQMFCMMECLADKSWIKLLKEKMMKVWEKKIGKEMDKTAMFFVEGSMMKWMDSEAYQKNRPAMMEEFMKNMEAKKKKK